MASRPNPAQLPARQVLPGSQQGWPSAPHSRHWLPRQVVPEREQKPPSPQQGWPTPPQTTPWEKQDPLSVQVPAPPPHGVPAATHAPSLFTQELAPQTLPRQTGLPAAPHIVHRFALSLHARPGPLQTSNWQHT